jgi:hypothetical protein
VLGIALVAALGAARIVQKIVSEPRSDR